MKLNKINASVLVVLITAATAFAQQKELQQMQETQRVTGFANQLNQKYSGVTTDEIMELYNRQSNFGMYKDNYFITGISTHKPVNSHTADAKFQVSIRQRLFNNILPYNVQLMLIYTQKSFWIFTKIHHLLLITIIIRGFY